MPPDRRPQAQAAVEVGQIDTSFLETLVGYSARRAALVVIEDFLDRMAPLGLRPVEFSVLALVHRNPGITSRQLCATLDILPPNLVGMIKHNEKRGLLEKREHPSDRRAQGLYLTPAGIEMLIEAEQVAVQLELDATASLNAADRKTLLRLLRKVYTRGR
ncbi:MAG: hypothetical protein RJA36_2765 [Pseudomonadota bacterium]